MTNNVWREHDDILDDYINMMLFDFILHYCLEELLHPTTPEVFTPLVSQL